MSRISAVWALLVAFGCKEPPAEPEPEPLLWNGCVTFDLVPAVKGCWVNYMIKDVDLASTQIGNAWVPADGEGRVCVEYRQQASPPVIIAGWGLAGATLYEYETSYQPGTPECGRDACLHLGELPCEAECYGGPEIGVPCTEMRCCGYADCMPDGTCYSTITGD